MPSVHLDKRYWISIGMFGDTDNRGVNVRPKETFSFFTWRVCIEANLVLWHYLSYSWPAME